MINIIYLILFIQFIIIIYLYYRTNKIPENFSTISNDIKTAINNHYKVDMDSIRNLASYSKTLNENENENENENTFKLPENTTIARDLIVNGDFTFTNKDNSNSILEIFPKYMVIAWVSETIPNGWAKCDNKWYKLVNGITTESVGPPNDTDAIQTPDLRGRFLLGAGQGTGLLNRKLTDPLGGKEEHTLTLDQLPAHTHDHNIFRSDNDDCGAKNVFDCGNGGEKADVNIQYTGGGQPHNNMPPYKVLYYIMKL
jgi:microcystin-dependent protein